VVSTIKAGFQRVFAQFSFELRKGVQLWFARLGFRNGSLSLGAITPPAAALTR
jgi:hypothetical protein